MNLSRSRIYQFRKSLDICAEKFLQSAIVENTLNDFMLAFERLQNLFGRNVLTSFRLFRFLMCLLLVHY